jgi:DNA primase
MQSQKPSPLPNPEPEELKRLLIDAEELLSQLKFPFTKEAHGYKIKCPKHEEKTPSCSVKMGPDGTLSIKCFGCGFGGNVLHLIAAATNLDIKTDFKQVKAKAYELSKQTTALPLLTNENKQQQISKFSPKHYHLFAKYLIEHYPASQDEEARAYLEKRGMGAIAHQWGCLPKDKARLTLLRSHIIRNLGSNAWYQSGIAYKGDQVISWPSHRLLIPWTNPQGQIESLQRRALEATEENIPKYVFPSTRFVPAIKHPFCRDWSFLQKEEKTIAICEGAFDTISFEEMYKIKALGIAGIQSLPEGLAPFLQNRYVMIALNNDKAGQEQVNSFVTYCLKAQAMDVKIVKPTHKDFNEDLIDMKMNRSQYTKK